MGLAASQARFLAITARKADCEFQSLQYAQDKLSITRELSQASAKYQDALNSTTLLWQNAYNQDDYYDLSYGVMMTPSVLNNYTPYLLTDRAGRIVLNDQYYNAINGLNLERKSTNFHSFIYALASNGVMSKDQADKIVSITQETGDYSYDQYAGYGSEPMNKNGATSYGIAGLIAKCNKKDTYGLDKLSLPAAYTKDGAALKYLTSKGDKINVEDETLGDLLANDYYFVYEFPDNNHNVAGNSSGVLQSLNSFIDAIGGKFKTLFGASDSAVDKAITNAIAKTQNLLTQERMSVQESGKKVSESEAQKAVIDLAMDRNTWAYYQNEGKKYNDFMAVDLSNLVGSFLTYFELEYNGYASGYNVENDANSSNLVIDDPYYSYLLEDSNSVTNTDIMLADYYMQLYNNLCINGYSGDYKGNIEDNESLHNLLKNGQLFVTSLSSDGYFYQGRYNDVEYIATEKDSDAITRAEAEYTATKTKLTYKEDQIDLQVKNLDAEISSLTTEYNSVQNLISKNVEKVFSMFQ